MRERGSVRKGMTPETDLNFTPFVQTGGGTERTNVNVPLSLCGGGGVSQQTIALHALLTPGYSSMHRASVVLG